MKKNECLLLLMLLVLPSISACSSSVEIGNIGLIVDQYGASKGADGIQVVPAGKYWVSWNQKLYTFPTTVQNYTWTKDAHEGSPTDESITFQTAEGLDINTDIGITYNIDPDKVKPIFLKYKLGVEEITDGILRKDVRNAFNLIASKYTLEQAYGPGKAKLVAEVNDIVKRDYDPQGIIIAKVFLVSKFRLPEKVQNAIDSKTEATQKAQQAENEVAVAEAERKKSIVSADAERQVTVLRAQGQAQANYLLSSSLTWMLVEYYKVKTWDGKMPQVTGGNSLINFNGTNKSDK